MGAFPTVSALFDNSVHSSPTAQNAQYDPTSGLYYNRVTGTFSADPGGNNITTAPDSSQLAARNIAISNALYGQMANYGAQYSQAQAGEGQLAQGLQNTINGVGPSVAQTQLQQGLGQISSDQLSQASGQGGQNGALARMIASQNIAKAQASANQSGALVRADEVAGARNSLGQVLGNQANQANQANQTATSGALGTGGEANTSNKQQNDQTGQNEDFWLNAAKAGGSAIAAVA